MANKRQLKNLLKRLNDLEGSLPLNETKTYLESLLDEETKNFQTRLKDNPTVQFLDDFNSKLEKFKKDFNLEPIIAEIETIQKDIGDFKFTANEAFEQSNSHANEKSKELTFLIKGVKDDLTGFTSKEIKVLLEKIVRLEDELSLQSDDSKQTGFSLKQTVTELENKLGEVFKTFDKNSVADNKHALTLQSSLEDKDTAIAVIKQEIEQLRKDFMSRLTNIGGGSINRQININSSVMSTRYTDINFQAFGGIAWSAVDDDTNKRVNVRASITAALGGGGGVARTVSVISVSSTLAAAASTDYAIFANVGITITLPTAISNTNLYTVKNEAVSSVLVATTAGETIDGSATVLLPTQYESLSFISNGSVWGVT